MRYADDAVLVFEKEEDARRVMEVLPKRFEKYGLSIHPEKTRLIRFGRFAAQDRKQRGEGKPETFTFLGFTHICGKKRSGMFTVLRQTIRQRLQAKLHTGSGRSISRMAR